MEKTMEKNLRKMETNLRNGEECSEDAFLHTLLQQRTSIVNFMVELLEEKRPPAERSQSTRRIYRFLKTSTFWEEDCADMPDDIFTDFFRVSKHAFGEILEMIYPSILRASCVGDSIEPPRKLALTLRFLATGDSFGTLAHLFRVGQSTVRGIIKDVSEAISAHPEFNKLVQFPSTDEEFYSISKDFFDMFQFPNVVGAVDDTHIKIQKPATDPASYFDYKKNYSIHLQAVCDSKTRVLFYYIGAPGKNNDGGVAEISGFNDLLNSGRIPPQYHIVGDPAFALHPNLLNRFPGLHLQFWESRYNWRQSRCRMVIESLFGRLKGRWNILMKPMAFKNLNLVTIIVKTCVLLHNFLLSKDDAIKLPKHIFQDKEYKRLMAVLDDERETALATIAEEAEQDNSTKKQKRKQKPLSRSVSGKEKRAKIALALENELSEKNCVVFLAM